MHMTTRLRFVGTIVIIAVIVAPAAMYTVNAASQTRPPRDPIAALLDEVHALRIAMEQSATVAPRVQLTLARLNIEEQRIAQLAVQLDQVRRELSGVLLESQKLSDQLPELERGLLSTSDDKARKSYEYEQTSIKQRLAAQSRLETQLRSRESEAAQALSTEQGRWTDLNARLDELERLLAPVPR
jgi:hypothetical protein